jgi:hypothetical protein
VGACGGRTSSEESSTDCSERWPNDTRGTNLLHFLDPFRHGVVVVAGSSPDRAGMAFPFFFSSTDMNQLRAAHKFNLIRNFVIFI